MCRRDAPAVSAPAARGGVRGGARGESSAARSSPCPVLEGRRGSRRSGRPRRRRREACRLERLLRRLRVLPVRDRTETPRRPRVTAPAATESWNADQPMLGVLVGVGAARNSTLPTIAIAWRSMPPRRSTRATPVVVVLQRTSFTACRRGGGRLRAAASRAHGDLSRIAFGMPYGKYRVYGRAVER